MKADSWSFSRHQGRLSRTPDFRVCDVLFTHCSSPTDATMLSCRLACGVSLPELTMGVAAAEGRRKASDARTVYGTQRLDLLDAPLPYVCFVSGMINVTAIDEADGLELYEELLSDLDRLGGRRGGSARCEQSVRLGRFSTVMRLESWSCRVFETSCGNSGHLAELQQKAPFALTCVRTVVQWVEKLTQDDRGLAARALFEKRLEDLLRIAFQNIEHFVDVSCRRIPSTIVPRQFRVK